ncbi:N-acetylmuramoyl-L-alanine amidase LytC precursor [Sporomusa ovata DSM 2662]|uniref:N-acetylmuramoyl-L-alanine amidase n=1 Tax=Sporomusa ovata TaxID=2378 RepID=A0A0U1L176_9FIRM|nr:N-acetylmuramoyl-L-alanine amidase [Sporomusa ovata]EQB27729.1 cell wall hydrolase/autolysin [Sporomusa ovata DSM 2662]CQR72654.1 N-acetylmuramoyl-L-alanine amidase [Sporomusa ovata]
MPVFISYVTMFIAIIFLFSPMPAAAELAKTLPASVVAVKTFQLDHKDVVAVAVETRLPAAGVPDPLAYTFEPHYHITERNHILTLTVAAQSTLPADSNAATLINFSPRLTKLAINPDSKNDFILTAAYSSRNTTATVTTVKRKRVMQPDDTIIFRTYLVLTFSDILTSPPHKTIVLDPGHGGTALGATSNYLLEKELNLDISLLSRDIFRQHGYDVYMTRTDDSNPSLLDRADAANILQADVFLAIHNNSMPADMPDAARKLYRGTTALYNSAAPKPAKELATLLANELANTLHLHQYPLQDRPGLVVLNSSWVPAVIVEVAMMPYPQDAKMLSQRVYRQQAAQAIFQATEKYFSVSALTARRN